MGVNYRVTRMLRHLKKQDVITRRTYLTIKIIIVIIINNNNSEHPRWSSRGRHGIRVHAVCGLTLCERNNNNNIRVGKSCRNYKSPSHEITFRMWLSTEI